MTEEEVLQKWRNLTIQDNYLFSRTMELNPDLCRQLLELILRVKIKSINYLEREKVIEERTDCKGIRLDVYVEDKDNNRSFDVEMQISDSDNLGKRMRYYQGMIDADKLKHGQKYHELGESYIVFICTFDKFRKGRHIYTFKEICVEDRKIQLKDGAVKVFLNTNGTADDVSEDVHNFLNYVGRGIVKGAFVKALDDAVQEVKSNRKVMKEYMTFEMYMDEREERSRAEGRAEGIEINRVDSIRNLIKNMRLTAEQAMNALGIPKKEQAAYLSMI